MTWPRITFNFKNIPRRNKTVHSKSKAQWTLIMYSTNTARSRINSFQNHNRKRGYYHQDEFNPKSSCTKTNFCSRIITSSQIRPTHIFQHKPFLMSVSQVLLFKSSFSNTFHPNLSIHAANLYQLSSDLSNRQCLPQTKTTLIKSTHLLPTHQYFSSQL